MFVRRILRLLLMAGFMQSSLAWCETVLHMQVGEVRRGGAL